MFSSASWSLTVNHVATPAPSKITPASTIRIPMTRTPRGLRAGSNSAMPTSWFERVHVVVLHRPPWSDSQACRSGCGVALPPGRATSQPVADVEDESQDDEEPAPATHPDHRSVGQHVEERRVREKDQSEERNEEA